MNADDVIAAYITEVALQLPRKQRNDVAFELRALITEGMQDRAEASGRAVDAAMATEFLQQFGRPEDVAAGYRPTLTIIDPADGPRFLRASLIGLAIIWTLGLLLQLRQPLESGWDLLSVLGQWWTGTAIPSLWWPGVLVAGFAAAAWTRRRWPQPPWTPRAADRIHGGRASMLLGLFGILCGLFVLTHPSWILDFFWAGKAAPAAYQALTYTDSFLQRPAPWLLALLLTNIPIYLIVIAKGRWPKSMRRIESVLSLLVCAVMIWTVVDGPVFMTAASDRTTKFLFVVIVGFVLLGMAIKWRRRVRPMPTLSPPDSSD